LAVVVLFAAVFFMIIAQFVDRASLLCPHCKRPPIGTFDRGTAENADFCPHCFYWLNRPW
jgi:hypothetical protein